jgi:ABC-type transport system involved in multi-copper enzyme maturation permease subunit
MSARQVLAVVRLTIGEMVRRRTLLVLLLLALGSVAIVTWGVDQLVTTARREGLDSTTIRLAVSQVLILIAFLFSFVLAMSAAFLAAPAIAADIETGTVLAILARPTSRADLVVGRWIGLMIVIVGYTILSGALALIAVRAVSGWFPGEPVLALGSLAAESAVVLTLALALGVRLNAVAAGAVTVVLFALSWFGGVLGSLAVLFEAESVRPLTDLLRYAVPSDILWRGVIYALEPPLVILMSRGLATGQEANPFFASSPPPPGQVLWAFAWVGLVLVGAVALFRRREL